MTKEETDLYRIEILPSDLHPDFVNISMHVLIPGSTAAADTVRTTPVTLGGSEAAACIRGMMLGAAAAIVRGRGDTALADDIETHMRPEGS